MLVLFLQAGDCFRDDLKLLVDSLDSLLDVSCHKLFFRLQTFQVHMLILQLGCELSNPLLMLPDFGLLG